MSWSEFRIDLQQLHDAIGSVGAEAGSIGGDMSQIASEFSSVKSVWDAPSEQSFETVQQWFTTVQNDLKSLLDETVRRLQAAYDNYHDAEVANTDNVT
jgi:uncharacterized protein YukE